MRRPSPFLAALLLLVAACGDPGEEGGAPAAAASDSPQDAFETVMRTIAARDWNALYLLNAPSERKEAERRWDTIRLDRERWEDLGKIAEEVYATREEVAGMTLREVFVRREHTAAGDPDASLVEYAKDARYLDAEPAEGGAMKVRYLLGFQSEEMLMRQERGRWYVWQDLTDLVDLAEPW